MEDKRIRVLMAKVGLDGHEQGAWVVGLGLRDAGMEVIYTGIRQTPERIAEIAMQEGVDVIGVSILSGAHLPLIQSLTEQMRNQKMASVMLLVGGILPLEDVPKLKEMGVHEAFHPGTKISEIVEIIHSGLQAH